MKIIRIDMSEFNNEETRFSKDWRVNGEGDLADRLIEEDFDYDDINIEEVKSWALVEDYKERAKKIMENLNRRGCYLEDDIEADQRIMYVRAQFKIKEENLIK